MQRYLKDNKHKKPQFGPKYAFNHASQTKPCHIDGVMDRYSKQNLHSTFDFVSLIFTRSYHENQPSYI